MTDTGYFVLRQYITSYFSDGFTSFQRREENPAAIHSPFSADLFRLFSRPQ